MYRSLLKRLCNKICQYVVIPTRRSSAEAFQISFAHAFGDAGSPYLIGLVSKDMFFYYIYLFIY